MHPEVVGVGVAVLVVGVGEDHLGPLAADDLDQSVDGLVEVGVGEGLGPGVGLEPGMPESR